MDENKKKEIKGQIEYYLSDSNLETDEFFHNMISKDINGYLELENILQCNKIKKAGWTKEEIIESIKESDKIELNEEKTKVRRKDNRQRKNVNQKKKKRKKESRG